jgi:2-polyprenyl-3-methyl-5-hydroxy-6-metoxy-1,4-benzoquinol methylase
MENKNRDQSYSWLERDIKRFKELGYIIPPPQTRLYTSLRDRWVWGKTVIDIGCSIGIGSNLMSHTARHVWGVDLNEEAIKFAKQVFERPNLSFEQMDIENPTLRELAPFEVVVMSEVIEHLDDPEVGISFMKRFFDPKLDTVGFITAPNPTHPVVSQTDAANELHLHHWNPGEFYELLTKHFNSVTLFNGDIVDYWTQEETVDGTAQCSLIIAKVEGPK